MNKFQGMAFDRLRQRFILVCMGLLAVGCSALTNPGGDTTSSSNMVKTASGLHYQDLAQGTGAAPQRGQTVSVHYTGWLADGKKFDSSLDRGQPLQFALGTGRVIKGWDEGLSTMRVGGKRRLVIPPDLAYGAQGSPPVIPPNATLTFEVELLAAR